MIDTDKWLLDQMLAASGVTDSEPSAISFDELNYIAAGRPEKRKIEDLLLTFDFLTAPDMAS